MRIIFDNEKNKKLKLERGVSFEIVIEKMSRGKIILDFKHPNIEKYPNQRIMVIEIDNYPYCVPYIQTKEKIVLKTVCPDRRFKKFIKKEET